MKGRVFDSPIGKLGIWGCDGAVEAIVLGEERDACDEVFFLVEAEKEIMEYFAGERKSFSFPYRIHAKGFQLACLTALLKVPYGKTISYAELSRKAGVPGGARAVGNAMNKNPLPILVPCHRVIRSDGGIGGFSTGIAMKRILLELEGIQTNE